LRKELLISRKEIDTRVQELALEIAGAYKGKEPVLLGILNGVIFFFADLVMAMQIPSKIDFIRAASYGSGMVSKGTIRFTKDAEIPLFGEDVILIEDIVDTGRTLDSIIENIQAKEPTSLRVCTLIDKVERREKEVPIDYRGFKVNEGFLVGYGLDHDERFRCLPDIYVIR
jgi:hypoxanthine phosphoribosyltransferase